MIYDAIVIGGGAAGLFYAYRAAKAGKSVIILDHNAKLARKIKISGGGRCNFTNLHTDSSRYICSSPHFVKAALKNFTPQDFIALMNAHNIAWHEKEEGQLFTTEGSGQIINMLINLCQKYKVDIAHPVDINRLDYDGLYRVNSWQSRCLILASGGLSFQNLGASAFGYEIAQKFGHDITALKPALVPLKTREDFSYLSGISLDVKVTCAKQSFSHKLLFTHKGLSGPAILQISSYWQPSQALTIDLLPQMNMSTHITQKKQIAAKACLSQLLRDFWPKKFVFYFMESHQWQDVKIAEITKKQIALLEQQIHQWEITPIESLGYEKAEVTCGGVSIKDISAKTMESRKQKGLYFIGEVLDVTGQLGGYNLQWAWSSAALAAQNL